MSNRHKIKMPIENRFLSGTVIKIDKDVIHLSIENFDYGTQARVRDYPLNDNSRKPLKIGSTLDIFVLQVTEHTKDLWYASYDWGNKDKNPWIVSPPIVGQKVEGVVKDHIENYGAIIETKNKLNLFLHISKLPGANRSKDIAELLYVGDEVAGFIDEVKPFYLEARLDINSYVKQLRRKAVKSFDDAKPPSSIVISTYKPDPILKSDTNVLVIDNDQYFISGIKTWLSLLGANVFTTKKIGGLKYILNSQNITHILADYHLNTNEEGRSVRKFLKTISLPIAIISGSSRPKSKFDIDDSWSYLTKPIRHKELLDWLISRKKTDLSIDNGVDDKKDDLNIWAQSEEQKLLNKNVNNYLESICTEYNCLGAAWFLRERKGVYATRAWYGIDIDNAIKEKFNLSKSAIHNVIKTNTEIERKIQPNDPIRSFAPINANYYWIFPLKIDSELERAIIIFSHNKLSDLAKTYYRNRKLKLSYFVEQLYLLEYIEDNQSFATLGRLSSAIMHETRGSVSPLIAWAKSMEMRISTPEYKPDVYRLKSEIQNFIKQAKRVEALTTKNMNFIQKTRRKTIRLNTIIERIVTLMNHKCSQSNITIVCQDLPQDVITTNLPPENIEQPLINLIDNSIFHIKLKKGGKISISVNLDFFDRNTPIRVKVSDNGNGMNAKERQSIFKPRYTSKGLKGYGIGLYVSRKLLRAVGGDLILLKSIRWVGSIFEIRLPLTLDNSN